MSKHISKEIAEKINKEDLERYYYSHLPRDTMKHFEIPSHHVLNTVLSLLKIRRMSPSEITKIQIGLMSEDERKEIHKKISEKIKGTRRSDEVRKRFRESQKNVDHSHLSKAGEKTRFKKGVTPWNKNLRGAQKWVDGQAEKRLKTLRDNGTFNTSSPEEKMYEELCLKYGNDDVVRQHKDDRYGFACDFYIRSEDLFIELNKSWTHGGRPFDPNDKECIKQLEMWKEKAKTSDYYKNAIYTWTDLDIRKQNKAKENNLNYLCIY